MDGSGLIPVEWLHRIDAACDGLEGFLDERRTDEFDADVAQAVVASLEEGSPRVLDATIAGWYRQAAIEGFGDASPPEAAGTATAAMDLLPELTREAMLPYLRSEP